MKFDAAMVGAARHERIEHERHEWECAANRDGLLDEEPFAGMLTLTCRPRWIAGSTGSPRHNYAWFIWDWRHCGPVFHLRGR